MNHPEIPPKPSFPHFTDRARNAMLAANRLAQRRNSDTIGSLFIVISAINLDERIQREIPQFRFSTDTLLDRLYARKCDDQAKYAKDLISKALSLAQSKNNLTIVDTTHILLAATTAPNAAILAMLTELNLTHHDVASVINKMLDDSTA